MKRTVPALLFALLSSGLAMAGGEGWSSDFAAAKKEAAESKKDLLMDFTGSDWCSWCIKLNKEVFSHDEFKNGVKDKFVLVEVDFPQDKSKLSEDTQKQNKELGDKYKIQGYPTILLADAEGRPFAKTGYEEGGPEKYVKHLDELRAKKDVRDKAFAEAAKAKGPEKAKALVAALKAMELEDEMVANFYGSVVEDIKSSDPQDTTGYAKGIAAKQRIAKFQEELNSFAEKEDHAGALALVDKTLKEGGFDAEAIQQITMMRCMIYAQTEKFDEAIKAAMDAKAAAPDSPLNGRIDGLIKQLEGAKKKAAEPKADDKEEDKADEKEDGDKDDSKEDEAEEKGDPAEH